MAPHSPVGRSVQGLMTIVKETERHNGFCLATYNLCLQSLAYLIQII